MSLSTLAIHRPVATMLLTLGLAIAGLFAFQLLPVAPLPQVDFPDHHGAGHAAGRESRNDGVDGGDAAGTFARPHRRHQRNDVDEFAGTDARHFAI